MFETMSIYSLVLMLSAALLFPPAFRHLLGAPRAVLLRTSWNLWAVTLPFAALCWFLAALWAQASRPLDISLAAVIIVLALLSLVFAFLPVKPRAGLGRYSLTLAILVAYATVCWSYKSLFAAVSGASFDAQALMFGYLLLCPALTAALLPRPRPIATGLFIVLAALLLYAIGIWATSAFWGTIPIPPASMQLAIVSLVSLLMLAVLAWMVWQARDTQAARYFGICLLAVGQRLVVIVWGIGWIVVHILLDVAKGILLLAQSLGRAGLWIVSVLIPGIGVAVARGSVVLFQMLWRGIKSIPALFWNITVGIGNGLVNAVIWFVSVPILGIGRGIIAIGDGLWHGLVDISRALFRASVWLVTFALPSLLRGFASLAWGLGRSLIDVILAIAYGLVALAGGLAGSLMDLGRVLVHVLVASPRVLWRAGKWFVRDLIPGVGHTLLAILVAMLHDISVMARGIWHGLGALILGFARAIYAFADGLLALLVAVVHVSLRGGIRIATVFVPGVGHALIEMVKWSGTSLLRLLQTVARESIAVARGVWHAYVWLLTVLVPNTGRAIWRSLLALGRGLVRAGVWLIAAALPAVGKAAFAMTRGIGCGLIATARGIWHGLGALERGLLTFLVTSARSSRRIAVWLLTDFVPGAAKGLLMVLGEARRGISVIARSVLRALSATAHALIHTAVWSVSVALPSIGRGFIAAAHAIWHNLLALVHGLARVLIWLATVAPVLAARKTLAAARIGVTWLFGVVCALGRALVWTVTVLLPGIAKATLIISRHVAEVIRGAANNLRVAFISIIVVPILRIGHAVRDVLGLVLRTLRRVPVPVFLTAAAAFVVVLAAAIVWPSIETIIWPSPPPSLRIVGGSNLKSLEPILQRWGSENQVTVQVTYRGSLDIQSSLEDGSIQYDAVWQGDSLWTTIGEKSGLLKDSQSIMCSPVVLGAKKSVASRLGWTDNKPVRLREILDAAESAKLRMFMASPAKSNSGALAYLGFLNSFDFDPNRATRLLRRIERTSDSSGWLRDTCEDQYGQCDAMINYESLILEMNREMVTRGQEAMYIVYPTEGLGLADFPLSFVKTGGAEKESLFLQLKSYLQSDAVQNEIAALGNRVGERCDRVNDTIFKPEWGADLTRTTESVRHPEKSVIDQALNEYQRTFRKPSFTIYLLDFSTSMQGSRRSYLQMAMSVVLDQKEAAKYKLQGTSDDATIVLPFAGRILTDEDIRSWTVSGSDSEEFNGLLKKIQSQPTADMTNIYTPVAKALYLMKDEDIGNYMPAIILLTDGESNRGSIEEVKHALEETGLYNIPIFGITFGDASQQQLNELAGLTCGRVFDGTKDLIEAFRLAKGQN